MDHSLQHNNNIRSNHSRSSNEEDGAGLIIQTLKVGNGTKFPKKGDICLVHYKGFLEDGTTPISKLESPVSFQLGARQVIEGWEVAVSRMSQGQISRVIIPPIFGYGSFGYEPMVPPNATLIFEIELLSFRSSV